MELLPRNDPSRKLHSAARSARGLGVLQLLLAAVIFAMAFILNVDRRDFLGTLLGVSIICFLFLIAPGSLSILFAAFIQRRRRWAVISMIVLASLELLVIALIFLGSGLLLSFNLILLVIGGLFLAALILLVVQLCGCFGVLRTDALDYDRGFAPIMLAQPVERSNVGDNPG